MRTARTLVTAAAVGVAFLALSPPAGAASCALTSVAGCPASPDPATAPIPTTTTTTQPPQGSVPAPAPAPSPDQARARLLALVNQERTSRGLGPLAPRSDVDAIASQWSDAMANAGDLSHNDAYFTDDSHDRLGAELLGENVARAGDIDTAHRALMASEHHRANILDARFTTIGLGTTFRDGNWWITEDFLQPRATTAVRAKAAGTPRVARVRSHASHAAANTTTSVVTVAPIAPAGSVASAAATVPHPVEVLAVTAGPSGPALLAGEELGAPNVRQLVGAIAALLSLVLVSARRLLRRAFR